MSLTGKHHTDQTNYCKLKNIEGPFLGNVKYCVDKNTFFSVR